MNTNRILSVFALCLIALPMGCATPAGKSSQRAPDSVVGEGRTNWGEFRADAFLTLSPSELETVKLIANDLKKITYEVKKPFNLYHHAPGSLFEPTEKPTRENDPAGFALFRMKVNQFLLHRNQASNMAGGGLYAATDPVATYSYGPAENFILIQTRMTPGLKVLDSGAVANTLSSPTTEALAAAGCTILHYSSLVSMPACGKYFKLAMLMEQISTIHYAYDAAMDCEYYEKAFVIVNPDFFKSENISIFTNTPDFKDGKTKVISKEIYSMFQAMKEKRHLVSWDPEFQNETFTTSGDEWNTFLADRIVSCPNVATHLAKVEGEEKSPKRIEKLITGRLKQNENFPDALYTGQPVIRLVSAQFSSNAKDYSQSNSERQIRGFCDGLPECAYATRYLNEAYSSSFGGYESQSMKIEWDCLSCDGTTKRVEKTFPLKETLNLKLSCEKARKSGRAR